MRKTFGFGIICVAATAAIGACGSSGGTTTGTNGTSDGGSGGKASTSSTSSTTATTTTTTTTGGTGGTSTTGTTSSTGTGTGGSGSVNNCTEATAEDHTTDSTVTITFDNGNLTYKPACIKIKTGTMVTWSGDFSSHPLTPGINGVEDTTGTPIMATMTGMSASFTFPNAGTFPYYCAVHFSFGMEGAVFVQ
jgi:plastocyanin